MHTNPATTDTLPILQPVVREYLAGGRVKGSILRAPVLWARECASTHQWSDLQVSLPAEVRRAIASVFVAARWYPFAWLVDFQRAIVSTLGDGDRSILRQAGRHAAATNLASILRALDRDDPHRFLHLLALLHTQFQDFGSATYERLGSGHGRMAHRHHRCFSPYHCESSAGYYEQCVRMEGRPEVRVEEVSCQCAGDSTCTFEIRWS